MYYGILRSGIDNSVIGFIVDEDEKPIAWKTERDAYNDLKDHSYFVLIDIIEID